MGTRIATTNAAKILLPMVHALTALVPLQVEQASAQYLVVCEHHERMRQFHIGAGEAQVTLYEFSRQSGLQMLYDFDAVIGIRTREVNGEMEPAVALRQMIDGTRLAFEFVNDGTVTIIPVRDAAASGRQELGDVPALARLRSRPAP